MKLKMKSKAIALSAILTLFSGLNTSCVTHTNYKDEARESIRFSSAQAAQTFYDAYLTADNPKGNGCVAIGLYLPLPYRHVTFLKDNIRYNAEIKKADTNHNGIISEAEARAYEATKASKAFDP